MSNTSGQIGDNFEIESCRRVYKNVNSMYYLLVCPISGGGNDKVGLNIILCIVPHKFEYWNRHVNL